MTVPKSIPVGRVGSFRRDVTRKVLCPRCQQRFLPIGYRGAMSRADDATEVCSPCGQDEALTQFTSSGYTEPVEEWPVDTFGWENEPVGIPQFTRP